MNFKERFHKTCKRILRDIGWAIYDAVNPTSFLYGDFYQKDIARLPDDEREEVIARIRAEIDSLE